MQFIIFGGILITMGDIVLKQWINTDNWIFFVMGLAVMFCGEICLAFSYKYFNIAVASLMMVLANVLCLSLISTFIFKENLTLPQVGGLVLAIIALVLLEM